MKRYISILSSIFILITCTACAPKTNSPTTNKTDQEISSPDALRETFTLYFIDPNDSLLVKEEHEFVIQENVSREKLILDALKMGSKSDHLASPITQSAVIHSIKTLSGLCTIDLSEDFLNTEAHPEKANLMLHAIVNSLCELQTIQQVKFNIDGNTNAKIGDNLDLSQPLSPNRNNK